MLQAKKKRGKKEVKVYKLGELDPDTIKWPEARPRYWGGKEEDDLLDLRIAPTRWGQ
jgi:hypothetical protein